MAGRIAPLNRKPRRAGLPLPGVGGYDMPRGPYGEGGFPGSTPAAPPTHPQTPEGQRGGRPQLGASEAQDQWKQLPTRRRTGEPRQPATRGRRVTAVQGGNWDAEARWSPDIYHPPPGGQNQRNTKFYAGRQAMPGVAREYLAAPNPGKLGGAPARDRSEGFDNDAGAVVGGQPTPVTVLSRYVAAPDQNDPYAVDRPIPLEVHAFPDGYTGDRHVRGAVLSGQRYFGPLSDQQLADGQGQGAYGIARRRGPRHRPVRFERPGPWTANYYDVAPEQGTQSPDMIHKSPGGRRRPGREGTKPEHHGDRTEHRRPRGTGKRR